MTFDEESASLECVGAEKERTMSSDNLYYEVLTMGDFARGRRTIRTRKVRPLDTGCFWFRDCERCGWECCVTSSIARYDSRQAAALRGKAFAAMLRHGIPVSWLTQFFGATEEQVRAETAPFAAGARLPSERKAEAIRMRQAGQPVARVAESLGVSARQVMYWCQGAPGINRPRWSGVSEGSVQEMDTTIVERCEVLRARFK